MKKYVLDSSRLFSMRIYPKDQVLLNSIYDKCIEQCHDVPTQQDIFMVALHNLDINKLFDHIRQKHK